jgi:membrane protein DedA with SNARE-associated domain
MRRILERMKDYSAFIGVLVAIIIVSLILFYFNPAEIVAEMGVRNIYAFLFLFALLGGVSSFTSTSFYATVIALSSSGGLDPVTVGVIAGIGMGFGDSMFYLLGQRAYKAFFYNERNQRRIEKFLNWLEKKPKWTMPIIIYVYSGFTPFPGDLLMMSLAITGYTYRKAIIPMVLGNITMVTMLGVGTLLGLRLV